MHSGECKETTAGSTLSWWALCLKNWSYNYAHFGAVWLQFGYNLAQFGYTLAQFDYNLAQLEKHKATIWLPFAIAGGSWKREDALVDVSPAEAARSNLPGKCHRHSVGLYRSLFHGISHQSKLLSQVRCGSSEVFMATLLGKSLDWLWSIGFVHSSLNFHQRLCVLGMIDFISSHGLIKSQQAPLLTHIIWMGQWCYSIF